MCGRYAASANPDELVEEFDIEFVGDVAQVSAPRYNIAPTDPVATIYVDERDGRVINDRVHANIQRDGTFSVVPQIKGTIIVVFMFFFVCCIVVVFMFIVINLAVDIVYSALDPRVRLTEAKG